MNSYQKAVANNFAETLREMISRSGKSGDAWAWSVVYAWIRVERKAHPRFDQDAFIRHILDRL